MSENEFSWVDKQSVNGEDLFAEVSGTGAQFMERVKEVSSTWLYHMYADVFLTGSRLNFI